MRKAFLIGLVALLVLLSGCIEQSLKELETCMAKCQEVCKLVNQSNLDLEGFNQMQLEKTKDSLTINCSCPCAMESTASIELRTDKSEYSADETIKLTIKNNSANSIWYQTINWSCMPAIISKPEYLKLWGMQIYSGIPNPGKWVLVPEKPGITPQPQCGYETQELKAGEKISIDYWPKYFHDPTIFSKTLGGYSSYKLGFEYALSKEAFGLYPPIADIGQRTIGVFSNEFSISEQGDQSDCEWLEQEIKNLAEEIKYCEKDDDCILDQNLPHNCALGCYVIRSKLFDDGEQLSLIKEKNKEYLKKCPLCLMKCPIPPEKLLCEEHHCVEAEEQEPNPTPLLVTCNRVFGTESDKKDVNAVFHQYLSAGQACDINLANSIITEKSKEIVRFTCSNMADEVKCYVGRNTEIRVLQDTAVIYLTPFGHVIENPFLFTRENGKWKLDLYRMSNSIGMVGYSCDTSWVWLTEQAKQEFCCHFPEGNCPEEV